MIIVGSADVGLRALESGFGLEFECGVESSNVAGIDNWIVRCRL